jgi:hypothetical protein
MRGFLRSRSQFVCGVAVLVLALSGCLSALPVGLHPASTGVGKSVPIPMDWYAKALVHDETHNHSDIREHENLSTPNFELLGHDALYTKALNGSPAYGYGCGEAGTQAGGRTLFVVATGSQDLPFVLEDVTNPAHPVMVGEFYAKGMGVYDADITPDGKYVALAFDRQFRGPVPAPIEPGPVDQIPASTSAAPAPVPPASVPLAPAYLGFHGFCAGAADAEIPLPDGAAFSAGIVLVDVTDPAHPKLADWDPTPGFNLHSVSTALVDGVDWVTGSEVNLVHQTCYFVFDTVSETPIGAKLVRQSTFDSPPVTTGGDPPVQVATFNGHTDVALATDPTNHKLYAYLADWEGGVIILDMSVPHVPIVAAEWTPPHAFALHPTGDAPCYRSAIHEILPAPELWDGHYYLFAGQECPLKTDTTGPGGSVFVLDFTDPSKVLLVGSWHLPEDTGKWSVEYQASPHYLALVNRTLFISDYHAGLWAADVSNATTLKAPPSIGVYVPAIPSAIMPKKAFEVPFCEQVETLPGGALALTEDTTGLYLLRFNASDPAPAAPPFPYGSAS